MESSVPHWHSADWSYDLRQRQLGRNRFLTFNIDSHSIDVTSQSTHSTGYRSICTDGSIIFSVEGYRGGWDDIGLDPPDQYDTGVIEFYFVATDSWSHSSNTDPHFRNDHASAYAGGKVYAIGGGSDDDLAPSGDYCVPWVSSYDIATDAWTFETDLDQPRAESQVIVHQGVLYVIGGYGDITGPETTMVAAVVGTEFKLPFYDNFNRPNDDVVGAPWVSENLGLYGGHVISTSTAGRALVDPGVSDVVAQVSI
jgi:hypothetical protein